MGGFIGLYNTLGAVHRRDARVRVGRVQRWHADLPARRRPLEAPRRHLPRVWLVPSGIRDGAGRRHACARPARLSGRNPHPHPHAHVCTRTCAPALTLARALPARLSGHDGACQLSLSADGTTTHHARSSKAATTRTAGRGEWVRGRRVALPDRLRPKPGPNRAPTRAPTRTQVRAPSTGDVLRRTKGLLVYPRGRVQARRRALHVGRRAQLALQRRAGQRQALASLAPSPGPGPTLTLPAHPGEPRQAGHRLLARLGKAWSLGLGRWHDECPPRRRATPTRA